MTSKNKLPIHQLVGTSSEFLRFSPVLDGRLMHSLYVHRTLDGTIRVGSSGCNFPYLFHGVEDETEFCLAVLFVLVKDSISHGSFSRAAKAGNFVYTHNMSARVARWWALPDSVKYRGFN